jgi:hypothetical protein
LKVNNHFFIATFFMRGEIGDAAVTSQSVGETTGVDPARRQSIRPSILSNALQNNLFARFCQVTAHKFNLEIGPGQSIYCSAM